MIYKSIFKDHLIDMLKQLVLQLCVINHIFLPIMAKKIVLFACSLEAMNVHYFPDFQYTMCKSSSTTANQTAFATKVFQLQSLIFFGIDFGSFHKGKPGNRGLPGPRGIPGLEVRLTHATTQ